MKNIFLVSILSLIIFSCGEATNNNEDSPQDNKSTATNTAETSSSKAPEGLQLSDCIGIYVKTAHDGARLLGLRIRKDKIECIYITYEGMLPPIDAILENDLEDGELQEVDDFTIDLASQTFKCSIGSGKIDGKQVAFKDLKDAEGAALVLEKDDAYNPMMEM